MNDRPIVVDPVDGSAAPAGWRLWAFLVRLAMVLFGILQAGLIIRIVLLLLAADQSNQIVADVLNWTAPFVDPFKGMFRINDLPTTAGSFVDIAAIAALVGWSILEAIVVSILNVFDR